MPFNFQFTNRFKKQFHGLPPEVQKAAQKTIRYLGLNPRHPSLQTHKVHGVLSGLKSIEIFETYVTMKYRLTWEYGPEQNMITLRNIDNHDECLKNP